MSTSENQMSAKMEAALLWAYEMVQGDLIYMKAPVMSFEDYVRFRVKALDFREYCHVEFKTNGHQPPDGGYMSFEDFCKT
jgi:hypothetical protein